MQFDREENEYIKIFPTAYFGYTKVTIEKPLRKEVADIEREERQEGPECNEIILDKNGNPKPDPKRRDYERIPLLKDIDEYFENEVRPYVPDAWMDRTKDKIYEINFNKYFFKYKPLRDLAEITADILALEAKSNELILEILK